MPKLRAVLLDVDGTLVDSNDAHARAWAHALGRFGHASEFERVRIMIGTGGDKLLAQTVGIDEDSALGRQIDAARTRYFLSHELPQLKVFPQARELLERLHRQGLRLVVATSAKTQEMDALLELCGAGDLVYARTSSDDAAKSKPDPDIIQAALREADASAEEALMLGDTPYDVQAAARAGVRTVAVRSGGWSDAALQGALAIFDDAADLLAHYDESPFSKHDSADSRR